MSENGFVTFELDPCDPPPLSAAERREIAELAARPDSTVDTSDQPSLTDAFFQAAVRNPFHARVAVDFDAEVLAWLGSDARSRGEKLRTVLRDAMLRERTQV